MSYSLLGNHIIHLLNGNMSNSYIFAFDSAEVIPAPRSNEVMKYSDYISTSKLEKRDVDHSNT